MILHIFLSLDVCRKLHSINPNWIPNFGCKCCFSSPSSRNCLHIRFSNGKHLYLFQSLLRFWGNEHITLLLSATFCLAFIYITHSIIFMWYPFEFVFLLTKENFIWNQKQETNQRLTICFKSTGVTNKRNFFSILNEDECIMICSILLQTKQIDHQWFLQLFFCNFFYNSLPNGCNKWRFQVF